LIDPLLSGVAGSTGAAVGGDAAWVCTGWGGWVWTGTGVSPPPPALHANPTTNTRTTKYTKGFRDFAAMNSSFPLDEQMSYCVYTRIKPISK
jgi:hypothetical protein